jgi:hypothetical protein
LIEGTVVSGIDRKPVDSATVVLLRQKPSGHEDRGVSWRIVDETTLLSPAESFRFENFRGGEFVLAAFPSPTIRQAIGWTSPLSVGEGESLTGVQIVAGAPARARVTVLSAASGEAVEGALVQLRAEGGQRRRAWSRADAYGVADLDDVVEGTYTLRCDADGFLPFREAVAVRGTLEVQVRLTPASWMTCRFDHPAAASRGTNQWTLEMTVQRHDPAAAEEWVDVERIRRMVDLRLSDHARLQVPVGRLRLLYSLSRDGQARVDGVREVIVPEGSDTRETIPVETGEPDEPRSTAN